MSVILKYPTRARPRLAFRPSLQSIEQIAYALTPFYGLHCPISVIFDHDLAKESRIDATLGTVATLLSDQAQFARSILIVG
jgi:precorrin-4 methylase